MSLQVQVKDHMDKPVRGVQVSLVENELFRQGRDLEAMSCTDSSTSESNGLTFFICNTPGDGVRAVLKVGVAGALDVCVSGTGKISRAGFVST